MEETGDSCSVGHVDDTPTTTPVQPVPCDATDDQSAPPTSPGKPEVNMRSPRELVVTSPEAGADAAGDKVTCDLPASPIGAVSEQEREQVAPTVTARCSPATYRYQAEAPLCDVTMTSSFGESHVTRLQSFVDSVAAVADDATGATCWSSRARLLGTESGLSAASSRSLADLRKPRTALPINDEPLDLSVKHPPTRHPDPTSSSLAGEMSSFPFPAVVPPLLPLLACRESWIAHWAALAAASLQHSLLFPAPPALAAMTSSQLPAVDTPSGVTSSSPRSSSSSSSSPKMADERRRRTALTAIESFVEGSFKPRQHQLPQQHQQQRQSSRHHDLTNRKRRRRHLAPEVSSSGDEEVEEKRRRQPAEVNSCRAAKDQSVSPSSDDLSPAARDDVAEKRPEVTSQSKPEVNGGGGEAEYLSYSARYDGAASEHPLVSLEKFVGVSTPLFRSLASPPSAATSNGFSSPPDAKTSPVSVTSYGGTESAPEAAVTSSRSMRGDVSTSGSLGRGFSTALSLLCCNL